MTAFVCMMDISKYKKTRDRKKIVYPNIPSSIAPVIHYPDMLSPRLHPTTGAISSTLLEEDNIDCEVEIFSSSKAPHFSNQIELDNITRDLGLAKSKAEILFSRLKEWNLVDPSCKIS